MTTSGLVALVACALALVPVGTAIAHDAAPRTAASPWLAATPPLPVIRHAPDFALVDTDGRRVTLAGLRGHVVLVSFIYTSCTAACPLLTAQMKALQSRLHGDRAGRAVRFVSITVDPDRDTADALRAYAARFGADRQRWSFVRDSKEQLARVLRDWDEWTRAAPNGELDHPARVYLIDGAGDVREIYALAFFDERQAWLDVKSLLSAR